MTRLIGECRVEVYEFRIKSEVQGEEIYQHWLLFADSSAETVHMFYFEAPVKEWDTAWVAGESMLSSLMLHKQEGGPQPQLDKSTSIPSRATGEPDREAANDHFRRVVTLARAGDFERATGELNRAIELDPTNAEFHCNLGWSLSVRPRSFITRSPVCAPPPSRRLPDH